MPLLVSVRDLVFRSKIHAAAERLGVQVRFAPRGARLSDAARELGQGTVIADLSEPGVLDEIRAAREAALPVRVIGFLGHVEVELAGAARAAGVDEVVSRGQFVQRLDAILGENA